MQEIKVKGMSCQHCTGSVEKALQSQGATNINIDLATGVVKFDGEIANINELIEDLGFEIIG